MPRTTPQRAAQQCTPRTTAHFKNAMSPVYHGLYKYRRNALAKLSKLEMSADDIPYEEDVLRNRYNLKAWLRYLDFKGTSNHRARNLLFERAIHELPGSYKLWHRYLTERIEQVSALFATDPARLAVNNCFERALVFMNKMPRIWLMYADFLMKQHKVTKTRQVLDRALRSLPITQHQRVWDVYLPWVKTIPVPEMAVRVYRRYLKLNPDDVEEFIDYLTDAGRLREAANRLADILSDDFFTSKQGKTRHQLWLRLCDLISNNPEAGRDLKVEAIIRHGIEKFTDQVGRLWTALANYYIRLANFEKARDVFEEALNVVSTVRDFAHVWDAYAQFEDGFIAAHVQAQAEDALDEDQAKDFELRIARYEHLIDRRPLLLSSVMLRQNPHNVVEWQKRVALYKNPASKVETYTRALKTVDPMRSTGKVHTLWVNFAKYYEDFDDLVSARKIFERATQAKYKYVDSLATVWCEYAEFELRHQNYMEALEVLRRGTKPPRKSMRVIGKDEAVQKKLFRSTKLWCFYADLTESLASFEETKGVYDMILELRIATPRIILAYAEFLQEHKYFEEAFKAYERGVALFDYPYCLDIWHTYLVKFAERYGGSKLERLRDLFEQAIENIPTQYAKAMYIHYAQTEEKYGLARHAMQVYDRATRAVAEDDRFLMYNLYIARATELFGVTRTRDIYDKAIEELPTKDLKKICTQFAEMERRLGEIDRARAIYEYASQYCDPRVEMAFWKTWHQFEVMHGNADTFREMLRVKRSVAATYNTTTNIIAAQREGGAVGQKRPHEDGMEALEADALATQNANAIEAARSAVSFTAGQPMETSVPSASNPDEIELDEEEESAPQKEDSAMQVEQIAVPSAVFGSLKDAEDDGGEEEEGGKPIGALERLKRKKR